MANKLNVKKKKTDPKKYLKGLSINEMEDIETAVEEALENPVGTFTAVNREMAFRLSNLNKMVKTIGIDTKYIRKAIDRIDKKIDGLDGGSDFSLGDALGVGAGAFALRKWAAGLLNGLGNFTSKGAAGSKASTSMVERGLSGPLSKAFGASLKGLSSLLTPLAVLDSQDDYVLEKTAGGREDSRNVRKEYGDELLSKARKEFQPWYGASNLNVEDKNDREYVRKYLEKHKLASNQKVVPPKKENKIPNAINKKLMKAIEAGSQERTSSAPTNVFREFNPTERAEIIKDRLKLMTEVPGMMGEGMAPGVGGPGSTYAPSTFPGSTGTGSSGGGNGGDEGGNWGGGSDGNEGGNGGGGGNSWGGEGGIGDTATKTSGGGQYRPVRELSASDLSDHVINTIAGEVRMSSKEGVDAVINTMFNRLGTKGYGKSNTLEDVAMAGKGTERVQYKGYRQATKEEAEMIRARIREVASGKVPDNTHGAQEFRAATYTGPWAQRHPEKVNIGGNNFAKNTKSDAIGPYMSYDTPRDIEPSKGTTKTAGEIIQSTQPSVHMPTSKMIVSDSEQKNRPQWTGGQGKLLIQGADGKTYAYNAGSGSRTNYSYPSIPFGTYSIDKHNTVEENRSAHPHMASTGRSSFDINKGQPIYDPKIGRNRTAILIHKALGERMGTQGCLGIGPKQWNEAEKQIIELQKRGDVVLESKPDGSFAIHLANEFPGTITKNEKKFIDDTLKKQADSQGKTVAEVKAEGKKAYEKAERNGEINTRSYKKTSDTNDLEERHKPAPVGPPKKELTLDEKQKKLKEEHDRLMLDRKNDPKPPVKKDYGPKSFKEAVPNWVSLFETDPKKITPTLKKSDVTEELVKSAVEEAKQATEAAAKASEAVKNAPVNPPPKIPQTASNPAPLSKLSKTVKKTVVNPTEKTPGTDSNKTNIQVPLSNYGDPKPDPYSSGW